MVSTCWTPQVGNNKSNNLTLPRYRSHTIKTDKPSDDDIVHIDNKLPVAGPSTTQTEKQSILWDPSSVENDITVEQLIAQ